VSTRLGLVALGDSITNGRGTMVMGVTPKSWAQWLAEALDLPYTCRARDGARTADVVAEQLPRVRADYDVACLYTGVNDVRGLDWDAAAYERDLRTALTALRERAEHVVALTIPLDLGRPRAGAKVGEANAITRALARETGAACGELADLRGPQAVMPDAVHPTALGQLRIADLAAHALARAGRPAPVMPSTLAELDDRPRDAARYGITYGGWLARDLLRRWTER
jgi:lysophospholipase L1-like esterase